MVELAEIEAAIKKLTLAQRTALLHRQLAMFDRDTVVARGGTTSALRRRGIVSGRMPHARLTELGAAVAARLEQGSAPQ